MTEPPIHQLVFVRRIAPHATQWQCTQCAREVLRYEPPFTGELLVIAGAPVPHVFAEHTRGPTFTVTGLLAASEAVREVIDRALAKILSDLAQQQAEAAPRVPVGALRPLHLPPPLLKIPPAPEPAPEPVAETLDPWLRWMRAAGLADESND
jgi:hypothetical protein